MTTKERTTSFMSMNSGLFSSPASRRRRVGVGRGKEEPLLRTSSFRSVTRDGLATTPSYVFNSARIGRKRYSGNTNTEQGNSFMLNDILIGVINSAVLIPSMVGFTSIIYRDEFFSAEEHNYFPQLLKLCFLSAAVHQTCFILFSSLPFAVGQVQDAGLIFLSSMAMKIVAEMKGEEAEDVIATVVVALSLSTACLGILLMLTGYLRLAGLVQYLPLPVIGGYLAFIGLFCGESGLRLMTGKKDIVGITGLIHFFTWECIKLAAPGICAAVLLFIVSQRVENRMVLPALLFSFPVLFFLVLLITGSSFQDARNNGWVEESSDMPSFTKVFNHFQLSKIHWESIFPTILPDFFAMYAVVAFGSCLDVAAIQFEMGKPLNYDSELSMVGLSNFLSGITGGYTGSYLFSQSIFALRNGVNTRAAGCVVIAVEMCIFFFPIDLMGYLPRFFFGCVLLFVAFDMLLDWLFVAYFKLEFREYLIVWASFIAINLFGLEAGMTVGVVITALNFVASYSQMNGVDVIHDPASNIIRSIPEKNALDGQRQRIVALRLSGFQFFGSTASVINAVKANVFIPCEIANRTTGTPGSVRSEQLRRPSIERESTASVDDTVINQDSINIGNVSQKRNRRRAYSDGDENHSSVRLHSNRATLSRPQPLSSLDKSFSTTKTLKRMYPKRETDSGCKEAGVKQTQFVILDCSLVPSIDATAARGCFLTLNYILQEYEIELIFVGLSISSEQLLISHGVIENPNVPAWLATIDTVEDAPLVDNEFARSYRTLDEAIEVCENRICRAIVTNPGYTAVSALASVFPQKSEAMSAYFETLKFGPNQIVFRVGDPSDAFYIVKQGNVNVQGSTSSSNAFNRSSLFGHIDFFKETPYEITAKTGDKAENIFLRMSRESFNKMLEEQPSVAAALERAILKIALNYQS